jgi:hypothetical protein
MAMDILDQYLVPVASEPNEEERVMYGGISFRQNDIGEIVVDSMTVHLCFWFKPFEQALKVPRYFFF